MNIVARLIILSNLILLPLLLQGQAQNNSIFSRFGIGDLYPQVFSSTAGMGFAASGYYSESQTNTLNPASYGYLKKTSFDLGLSAKYYDLSTDNSNYRNWTGGFDYMSIAFPLFNSINRTLSPIERKYNLGMCFSLQQYSKVGYNLTTTETIEGVGQIERNYTGYGGTTKLLWGNSFQYDGFSAGVNLGYIFGRINYEKNIFYVDYLNPFNNIFTTAYSIRGFQVDGGLMYSHILNKKALDEDKLIPKNILTAGLHYSSNSNANTSETSSEFTFLNATNTSDIIDTLTFVQDSAGMMTIPGTIGFGLSYKAGNKWGASVAYSTSPWSSYTNDVDPRSLSDINSFNVGFYYVPKYNSITNFLSRINYKAGFYTRTEPSSFNGNQVSNMGVTFGLGMPFIYQRKSSIADINIALGRKMASEVLVENYMELRFGFSFNDDEWFLKRKYN